MILFGDLVLGVHYLDAPLAAVLMAVATVTFSSGLGLLTGVVARTEEQVVMLSIIPGLVLSGLGGAWMPLETTGEAFRAFGRLTPVAWSIQGFQNIVVRGRGIESVLVPAAVLFGYAAVLLALALWRFRSE